MNLIDAYRYLAALEQHRHFGRAAAACHITQPALSNALRALESHLDVAIVRRGRQYEGLTPEGARVLATAHRVLREQEALRQELAGSVVQPRGRLVIGAVPTALPVAARFAARLFERHPGLAPQVLSLPSQEIETGLDTLAIDLGLGYTERQSGRRAGPETWPQYIEHYYLLRRARRSGGAFAFGPPLRWAEAAALPLCLLSPEMHNRAIVDGVFRRLGLQVQPAIETNSVLALTVALQGNGALAAILPGAVVATLAGRRGLQALPLAEPELRTPIGFMAPAGRADDGPDGTGARRSLALRAALRLAADPEWLADAALHSGPLSSPHQ